MIRNIKKIKVMLELEEDQKDEVEFGNALNSYTNYGQKSSPDGAIKPCGKGFLSQLKANENKD
jgi:hypothetical protein